MTYKFQHDLIMSLLPAGRSNAITVKEFYDSMEDADKSRFGSVIQLGKTLNTMRENKLKGRIANGDSEIVNGSTRLTWYKLENDNVQSKPEKPAPVLDHRQESGDENLSQRDEAENQQSEAIVVAQSQKAAPILEHDKGPENVGEAEKMAVEAQTLTTDAAVETLARDGYVFLDPNDEIESALITMANYMRQAREMPDPHKIERKEMKIKALRLIAESPLIQADIAEFLGEIAHDLELMEAA